MEDRRPSGIVLWGTVSNRHMLRWLKTVVVSDVEKGVREASGGDQGDDCWVTCREFKDGIRTGLGSRIRDESGGCPGIGQAVSGIEVA
jgi:hypothetical protein